MHGSKGQYFLITALLLIVYFSTLARYTFNASGALQYKKDLEYWVWKNTFNQIKNEEKNVFEYFCDNDSLVEIVKNYTLWVRDRMGVSNAELRTVFLLATKSGNTLGVKLVNLADEPITNIKLTYNTTTKTLVGLDDGKEWDVSFTGSDNELFLSYEEAGESNNYTVDLGTKTGFWVMSLEVAGYKIKESFEAWK